MGKEGSTQESSSEVQIITPSGKKSSIFLSCIDVQIMNNTSLMEETPSFTGSPLIFLNFPKVHIHISKGTKMLSTFFFLKLNLRLTFLSHVSEMTGLVT